jgi:hypothetical protein
MREGPQALIRGALVAAAFLFDPAPSPAQTVQPIDAATAAQVLPDAEMAQDVFSSTAAATDIGNWSPVAHGWEYFFDNVGLGWETQAVAASGFYARIYEDPSGNITIAYRSTSSAGEFLNTDVLAQTGSVPAQYVYAAQLAAYVKQVYPNAVITLTGHSLGGGLATYAAQQVPGISNVVTFDSARPPILKTTGSVNQINVYVPGDAIGDPTAPGGKYEGSGYLPGKTYTVNSTIVKPQGQLSNGVSQLTGNFYAGSHLLSGIIGGLQNTTHQASTPEPSGATANITPAQSATPATPKPNITPTSSATIGPIAKPVIIATPAPIGTMAAPSSGFGMAPTAHFASGPGGISLSEAAAERMPIDIDLDGVYYDNGKLVLSGRKGPAQTLDASLVLTAMRAACEPGDPYFSLDPENGAAWLAQGQQVSQRLWDQISGELHWNTPVRATRQTLREHSLWIRTISAGRDYPEVWNRIAADYPDLRSKLVFRPTWLQQTRFGEIMYDADVLLKELASGLPVLSRDSLPAAKVPGYVSQLSGEIDQILFAGIHDQNITPEWQSSRFWFDLAPRTPVFGATLDVRNSSADRELLDSLQQHRMIDADTNPTLSPRLVVQDGPSLDLSQIYPTMFVRRHNPATNEDLPVDDPIMNSLANNINDRIEQFVRQYSVLQSLTEAMRVYVAAVHIIKSNDQICQRIRSLPLLDSEKATRVLPSDRPSELLISVARYAYGNGRGVRSLFARSTLVSGGVTIAGKLFYSATTSFGVQTPIIQSLRTAVAMQPQQASWEDSSGRQFISFNVLAEPPLATDMPSWRPTPRDDSQRVLPSPASPQSSLPPASIEPDSELDHGPGRVACDLQWSDLNGHNSQNPPPSYHEFIQNCMSRYHQVGTPIASVAPSIPIPNRYVALAFSERTGAWGSVNAPGLTTRDEAERIALNGCRKWAKDCKVVASSTACLGLAKGRGASAGWTGNRRDLDDAREAALEWCRNQRNSGHCKIAYAVCASSQ